MPNGVASSLPSSFVPTIDQATIGMVNRSATRKRLRMSRSIASIDIPGVAAVTVAVGIVGALHRGVVVHHALMGRGPLGHRIADVTGDRPAGAMLAALLHPDAQLRDRGPGGLEGHRRGLRDGIGIDGQHARGGGRAPDR